MDKNIFRNVPRKTGNDKNLEKKIAYKTLKVCYCRQNFNHKLQAVSIIENVKMSPKNPNFLFEKSSVGRKWVRIKYKWFDTFFFFFNYFLTDRIEEVNAKILAKIIEETDYVAVLFCK